jgi:hypothetical protein
MKAKYILAGAFALATSFAVAQPGRGPGPTPNPWVQNGATLSYDQGGVILPSTVTGGSKGQGTLNASGLYVNGVAVITSAGAPVQSVFGRTGTILAQTGDYNFSQISGTIATTQIPTGTSVADPGTGKLESLLPIQTTTGTTKTFAAVDLQKETRRSNAGSSMADTFPASSASGMANGARIIVSNVDASAVDLITAGAGTSFTSGSTDTIEAGRSVTYIYDSPNLIWRKAYNTGDAAIFNSTGSNSIGDIVTMGSIYGTVQDSGKSINNVVTGPASAVSGNLVTFNGTTGKVVLDSGINSAAIPLANIATIGANTILGNWGATTGAVAAKSMPSCPNNSGNRLNYVSGTGVTCGNTSVDSPYANANLGQLPGTTTNDTASAGNIGETISSSIPLGSSIPISTATSADVTHVNLTAGQWQVYGTVCLNPNASTSITTFAGWISTTSATLPSPPNGGAYFLINLPFTTGNGDCFPVGQITVRAASTIPIYLSVYSAFTVSTNSAYGYISAIRTR